MFGVRPRGAGGARAGLGAGTERAVPDPCGSDETYDEEADERAAVPTVRPPRADTQRWVTGIWVDGQWCRVSNSCELGEEFSSECKVTY